MNLKSDFRYAFLSIAKYASNPPRGSISNLPEDARVLLLRPDHIGDILLSTPALRALRQAMPRAHLTYLVGPWSKQVLANNPNVDEVLTCEFPGFRRDGVYRSPLAPYRQLFDEAQQIRKGHFDAAINLRFDFWWGVMLCHFAGIPIRTGYDVRECVPYLSHSARFTKGRHEVLQNIALIDFFLHGRSLSTKGPFYLEFHPSNEDESFAENWLSENGGSKLTVVIHSGSGAPVKSWTTAGFAEVASHLASRHDACIILTGVKDELPVVEAIAGEMDGKSRILVGASLGQLAAILKRCDLAVGIDSGPMHLAVAMGVPSVHLYGPVGDGIFGPWGDNGKHLVITSDMDCIPCNRLDYKENELPQHPCVARIKPSEVIGACDRLLQERQMSGKARPGRQDGV